MKADTSAHKTFFSAANSAHIQSSLFNLSRICIMYDKPSPSASRSKSACYKRHQQHHTHAHTHAETRTVEDVACCLVGLLADLAAELENDSFLFLVKSTTSTSSSLSAEPGVGEV